MTRNITLRMDEVLLKKCRYAAVEEDMSLSKWITRQIDRIVSRKTPLESARALALKHLEKGYSLGGHAINREKLHER